MTTYAVTVGREDNLWVAVVDGLPEGVVGAMDYENFGDIVNEFWPHFRERSGPTAESLKDRQGGN